MSVLTAGADLAWKLAAAEAASGGHPHIENALLLVGILSLEKVGGASAELALAPDVLRAVGAEARRIGEVLERCGLEAALLRRMLRERAGKGGHDHRGRAVGRSPGCKETFFRAAMLSGPAGVSAVDLLAALGEAPDALVARALREAGGSVERLREEARRAAREERSAPPASVPRAEARPATSHLDRYGRDLTALAARGELGPVIGRQAELFQLLQSLARASRNNPVLVGEPGVGKTAIVEALALRAAQGKDPAVLGGKRIVELSPAAILAEAKDRGAQEERAREVVAEARAHPEVVLFVDELHAADLLRPAFARGELRLIGATSSASYRRHVESDPDLERRCEKVLVAEPDRGETLEILRGLRLRWESRHQVRIEDLALEAAVDLSVRFDPDHNLPAKAIDLLDAAAARARPPAGPVTELTVAQVLAEKAGLSPELVAEGLGGLRRLRVKELEPFLRERILGQDEALARFCRRLHLAHEGKREGAGPLAAFLFLGPPGVGKTETARLTASFLFGSAGGLGRVFGSGERLLAGRVLHDPNTLGGPESPPSSMTGAADSLRRPVTTLHRFDLSEYAEESSVERLVGAPAGGEGPEAEGQLFSRLRATPGAVVLLEGLEKAHPRVLDLAEQALDTGRLTSGLGRTADARHAVFVLTSTLGPGEGPERFSRPELLKRLDETIVFRALEPEDAVRILRPRLRALCETVERQHGIRFEVDPEAAAFIARTGFDPACGVRELRRTVERLVEAPLSSLILDGKIRKHPAWHVAYDEGGIYVVPRT